MKIFAFADTIQNYTENSKTVFSNTSSQVVSGPIMKTANTTQTKNTFGDKPNAQNWKINYWSTTRLDV